MEKIQKRPETLEVRPVTKEDRQEIAAWQEDWDVGVTPEFLLPKRGYIVLNGQDKICASYLYDCEKISFMAWTVCNKKVDIEIRRKGLDLLLEKIKEESRLLGKKGIFTTIETGNIILRKRLEDNKFFKGDESVDHYIYFEELNVR